MSAHYRGAWDDARRVLCVRLDAIGDVLMTTPAIRALKSGAPGRSVVLLTSSAGSEVARLVPEIDGFIVYDAPWVKSTPKRDGPAIDLAAIDRLKSARFDGAVIFTVYSQNPLPAALLCYLAGIPLRLAYCRENPYRLLSDHVPEEEPEKRTRHEVARQLDLVGAIGCATGDERLSLSVPGAAAASADAEIMAMGLSFRPFVVIHPGSTAPSRRYPPGRFSAVADGLARAGLPVVFTGTDGERELVETVRGRMNAPSHSLAGRLTLAGLAAIIGRAALLIANNTGPAHIASALGTPVVSLYALTNPQHTPWKVESRVLFHDVPCKYCYKSVCPRGENDCLALVEPGTVVSAALDLIGRNTRSRQTGGKAAIR